MSYQVRVLAKARRDLELILRFIALKSPRGAARLLSRFQEEMRRLERNPNLSARAPEAEVVEEDLRHVLFKTRAGRTYRAIFLIVGEEVRILRVRGAGQAPLSDWELSESAVVGRKRFDRAWTRTGVSPSIHEPVFVQVPVAIEEADVVAGRLED